MLKRLKQLLMLIGMTAMLSACSKTVQWEEEVPLNTGEVIWVKRTVEYTLQGGGGNPLDIAYRPQWEEQLEFNWQGRSFVYKGEALVMVLAISPLKVPTLFARSSDRGWERNHRHPCSTPSYVQLVPDASGSTWSWPPAVEPWAYGLLANLLLERSLLSEVQKKYSRQAREARDSLARGQSPSLASIDPTFVFTEHCKLYKS